MENDENMICWVDKSGQNSWAIVSGEDAMQEFCDELLKQGIQKPILVFRGEDEIDNE